MNTRLLKTFVALLMLMPVSLFAQYVAQVTTSGNVTTQYATFSEALNNWGANCTLKLLANVETSSTIAVNSTRTLDLNGYGIRMTGTGAVIAISLGGNLTLNDSDPMAEHHFDVDANSVASLNEASGSLTIYGGYITGGTNNYGGGIDVGSNGTNYQNGPSLTMNAGTIIGNSGRVGGVCVARDDRHYYNTFTMNGGAVCYNNNTGVGVFPDGTFHMNGGTIHHNNTIGIEMWNSKLLTLNNAVITDNNTEGIRVDSRVAAIQVQGRTIVSGNHDYDVFYRRTGTGSRALSIVGELHSEARIGISNLDSYTPNPFTSGLNGRGNASNFFSNDPTMGVGLTANNEAHLASFPTYTAPTVISGLYYTGVAQALVNEGAVSGGTMYYSLDNTNWNTTIPTGTDVGDYTVYYRIVGDASHADVIPSPNTVEVTIVATVSMAEGTADVSNWSLSPTQATAGTTINVDYSGSKTVERAVVRRKYASTIDLNSSNATTAQNSFNSTANSKIVVSQDFNAGLTFTRTEGEIDLNGHANSSWFCVQNNVVGESVTIRNGSFLDIDGIGGWGTCYHGTIILENINCRNVFTDGHDYVIRGGAYENIHNYYNNGTPGTVTIYGGKFKAFNTDGHNPNGTLDGTYTLYGGMYKFDPTTAANCNVIIPNGYSVQLNPDIDNLDYPWVVVKTSDPLAQTSEPSFDLVKVGDNQWTFAMPAYNVEVEVTYVPDMSYTVEMASGTVDATNWNITSSPAQKGATVTLTYNGAMKVENVSLVKKSATQINASNASTMLQSSINSAIEEHPYIVLTDNIPCLGNVFITKPEGTVDLSGYNMCANLYIQNDVLGKTLTLRNGHVQGGADGDGGCPGSRRGTVVLDNLVIDGTLWCDGHEFYIYNTTIGGELQNIQFNNYPSKVTIFSGKFNALRHSCGNITGRGQYMVYGGKFKENYADWNICAPGYSFQANTDEDAATYPYVVKPISPVNAKSAANPKKAPANQPGYGITEVTSNSEWTFTMPASDVEVLVEYGLHGQGTEEDPFTISSADEWNVFAKMVNGGESFAGKFIRQTADISGVTQAVGTGSNRFSGTYDGYEHTLTLDINTNANYAAPFALLSGATIKNLHTDGEINTGGSFAGGIVGEAIDGSTIVNCLSTVTLTSSKAGDCTHGGLIGVSNGTTIEGCVFNGSLYTTNNTINCGGLVGWSQTNQAKTIVTNCLFDPVDFTPSMATNWSSTIGRDGGNSGACYTITNTYYTQAFGYTHQGKLVRSITAGDNVTTLGMAGTATVYNVSGITAYADNNGLKYGDMFFAGDADVVNLTLGHADRTAEGLFFDSYSASNGATIIGDILTVTTNNTIVSANYSQCPILTLNSDGNGTVGFSGGNLPQGVTPGSAANTYYVVPGTEVIIKATPKEHYHLDSWSNGSQVNTDDTIHVIVTTDSTITATFDTNTYVLNVVSADAAMGSVSGSNPAAKHFLSYEISATPNNGYHFVQWNDGNTDNPRTVTLISDSNFTATFAANSYTITYMDGQTELNVDTFDYRQPITEYTTSKQGCDFEGWNPEVPQLMPAENLVVYAQWSRICEPVTDVDNNTYPTVGIGNKCWMAENLRTTHYADGREITHIYEYQNEMYPNVQENVSVYGRLYDWYDAVDSARPTRAVRVQGICPDGWYLPNEEDFELLNNVNLTTLRSTNYWLFNPGTNTTGYDLRPAGMYNFATSRYEDLRGNAYLWSVSSVSTTEAHCHMADCHCYMIIDLIFNKQNASSVRCVKD